MSDERTENITLIVVDENHNCDCDHSKDILDGSGESHGPLCPGAVKPPFLPKEIEEPIRETQNRVVTNVIPQLIFIVPYRDREQQQSFFAKHMKEILQDMNPDNYKILYIHQKDKRKFNRGALKNIGFLFVKEKYPNDYKNITLVFNDVDTMPLSKNFINYTTIPGIVRHYYGFSYTLGGIVSIKASDFEKVLGFPNFWAWGYEDNLFQKRVLRSRLTIDRSQFYNFMDKNIIQLSDGITRDVNRGEFNRYLSDTTEGFHSIHSLVYNYDETTGFVNVTNFLTETVENTNLDSEFDLRNGSVPFKTGRRRPLMNMVMRK